MTISEVARLKGVSKEAISKRVKRLSHQGALEVRQDGQRKRISLVQFDRLVGATTDPAQDLRNGGRATAPARDPRDDVAGMPTSAYHDAKAQHATYQAENARLDLEERLGNLTDVDAVERRTFDVFRRVRDRLLALPATVADQVASAPDARAARSVLDEEMRKLLDTLAVELDQIDAETADAA